MKEDKYKKKYNLNKDNDLTNKYLTSISNPTVQPDRKTEMGVPIPGYSKCGIFKRIRRRKQIIKRQ